MEKNPANICLYLLRNELAAADESCQVPCRGGANSALVRFAAASKAAVTGGSLRRSRS
jgi:hypothetical protein